METFLNEYFYALNKENKYFKLWVYSTVWVSTTLKMKNDLRKMLQNSNKETSIKTHSNFPSHKQWLFKYFRNFFFFWLHPELWSIPYIFIIFQFSFNPRTTQNSCISSENNQFPGVYEEVSKSQFQKEPIGPSHKG